MVAQGISRQTRGSAPRLRHKDESDRATQAAIAASIMDSDSPEVQTARAIAASLSDQPQQQTPPKSRTTSSSAKCEDDPATQAAIAASLIDLDSTDVQTTRTIEASLADQPRPKTPPSSRLMRPTASSAAKVAVARDRDTDNNNTDAPRTTLSTFGKPIARSLKQAQKANRKRRKNKGRQGQSATDAELNGETTTPGTNRGRPPRSKGSERVYKSRRARQRRPGATREHHEHYTARHSQEKAQRAAVYDSIAEKSQRSRSNSASSSRRSSPATKPLDDEPQKFEQDIEEQLLQAAIRASLGGSEATHSTPTGSPQQAILNREFATFEAARATAIDHLDEETQALARLTFAQGQNAARNGRGQSYSWAFAASLAEDKMKIRRQEQERQKQARAAAEAEMVRQERADAMSKMRLRIAEEPERGAGVITVAIKLPDGSDIRRRFRITDSTDLLNCVVHCHNAGEDGADSGNQRLEQDYSFSCTQPRTVIDDFGKSFEDYGITRSVRLLLVRKEQ